MAHLMVDRRTDGIIHEPIHIQIPEEFVETLSPEDRESIADAEAFQALEADALLTAAGILNVLSLGVAAAVCLLGGIRWLLLRRREKQPA